MVVTALAQGVHRQTIGGKLYIPIHTNAFNGKVSGTRIFCYNTTGEGYKASKNVFNALAPVTPGTSESVSTNPGLYEVKTPKAPTVYIEVDFHECARGCKVGLSNTQKILARQSARVYALTLAWTILPLCQ